MAGNAGPAVVALGGGHGLSASLAALRHLTDRLTAVVTVADDGGSSGRLRRELGVLPPGDLRMALSALCDDGEWGRLWRDVLQHRFASAGTLHDHALGNLLIVSLWDLLGDTVTGLDWVGRLLGARGRVLPMAEVPLDLVARVESVDPDDPARTRVIRGQVAIAATPGRVADLRVSPEDPPVAAAVLDAIADADVVSLGPGSWFTSVLPHLMVPRLHAALAATSARLVVVLNLEPQVGETDGFSPQEHLSVLCAHLRGVPLHTVIADVDAVVDRCGLLAAVRECGAELVLAPVASPDGAPRHDPGLLSGALASVAGAPTSGAGTQPGAGSSGVPAGTEGERGHRGWR